MPWKIIVFCNFKNSSNSPQNLFAFFINSVIHVVSSFSFICIPVPCTKLLPELIVSRVIVPLFLFHYYYSEIKANVKRNSGANNEFWCMMGVSQLFKWVVRFSELTFSLIYVIEFSMNLLILTENIEDTCKIFWSSIIKKINLLIKLFMH